MTEPVAPGIPGASGASGPGTATFGAGCFWGVEAAFRQVAGVVATAVGYAGGHTTDPTYQDVCRHDTGHAEVVRVTFDPNRVTYRELLDVFWSVHDPTEPSGPDDAAGGQYRSVVFFHDEDQRVAAELARTDLDRSGRLEAPVATEICRAPTFYRAEDHHQQFVERGGFFVPAPPGADNDLVQPPRFPPPHRLTAVVKRPPPYASRRS